MSPRSRASALACALGLAGISGLAGCSVRPKAEGTHAFLRIRREEGPALVRGGLPPGSIALALGGLPADELTRLRECLAASADDAVRRAAPALLDLTGPEDDAGATADPMREAIPDLHALTAAANVLGAPWHAPGVSVELGPTCEAASSLSCVPLFVPPVDREDATVRRGRALAWTLGNAAVLHAPASTRASLLLSLRRAQIRPSGTIALVFDAPHGVLDAAKLELLRDEAQESLANLAPDAPQRPWLAALGAAPADWTLPVALDADELLVIPRLSALARLKDFRSEVEAARTLE
jgi:hypothetical protein